MPEHEVAAALLLQSDPSCLANTEGSSPCEVQNALYGITILVQLLAMQSKIGQVEAATKNREEAITCHLKRTIRPY